MNPVAALLRRALAAAPIMLLLVLWGATVAAPALALALDGDVGQPVPTAGPSSWRLLAHSLGWAGGVAVLAMLLGWVPGRVLGRGLGRRRFGMPAVLLLGPVCLPAYVVFWMWWQAVPPDGWVGAWAARTDHVGWLRLSMLGLGLTCWAWPLVAWCVAGSVVTADDRHEDALRLDGSSAWRVAADRLRRDARSLATGGLLVGLAVLGNTTTFDLAQVYTTGNQLRALHDVGVGPAALVRAAAPTAAVIGVLALVLGGLLTIRPATPPERRPPPSRAGLVFTGVLWLGSLAAPIALFVRHPPAVAEVQQFASFYGEAVMRTVVLAAATGVVLAGVTAVFGWLWQHPAAACRRLADGLALSWLVAALLPATLVATAFTSASAYAAVPRIIGESSAILVLAYVARFGVIAALLGRWLSGGEASSLCEARHLDGARGIVSYGAVAGPRLVAALGAAAAVTAVFVLGEIHVTAQLMPPDHDSLAHAVLNAMHYQRPDTVLIATIALLAGALLAATLTVVLAARVRRSGLVVGVFLLPMLVGLTGCGHDPAEARPLEPSLTFGIAGLSVGQFNYPRAIAADPRTERVFIVDKAARVQRFTTDGVVETAWSMPAMDNGKPTGISVGPDGTVYVADTHYWRIIAYTPDGEEILRFGGYGEGPGEFIYPTDVAVASDGRLYVSEYGGHDRIQVFEPDGTFVFAFGTPGAAADGPGHFNRPQSIAFSRDGRELYIADANNHRIVVTDGTGREIRTLAGPGRGAGELQHPYGLTVLADGSLLVAEFGNNRIQRLDATTGAGLGVYGVFGRDEGEVRYPWGVDVVGRDAFVLDSGNNRVQRIRVPGG